MQFFHSGNQFANGAKLRSHFVVYSQYFKISTHEHVQNTIYAKTVKNDFALSSVMAL